MKDDIAIKQYHLFFILIFILKTGSRVYFEGFSIIFEHENIPHCR